MSTATVTSKGQITVPKDIRELLGLRVGDRIVFRPKEDGSVVVEPETVDIRSLRGCLKSRVKGVSVEKMNKGIVEAVAQSYRRSLR